MPDEIGDLLAGTMAALRLKILVFGPQVHTLSAEPRTLKLQNKRIEIRAKLEVLGHHVRYAEDLVDPHIVGPTGNVAFQELIIMREYDLIVTIVDSPGSIAEATLIASRPPLAAKSALFLDGDYDTGFVADTCRLAEHSGAHFKTYAYPADLDDCHLYGFVKARVEGIQMMKYLL